MSPARKPARAADVPTSLISCELTARERAAVDELKALIVADDGDFLREAIAHYARWLEPKTPPAFFARRRAR